MPQRGRIEPRWGHCATLPTSAFCGLLAPGVDVHVTRSADHEGLALTCCHELFPRGLGTLALYVQVAKCADVEDFDIHR